MKQQILSEISSKLSTLGIPVQVGNGADITISTEFLDASWSTGSKKINYEASVFANEQDNVVYMYEKTVETGHGLSFGGGSGTSFQSGKTLFRKVKSVQYATDGKVYEYTLDLGAIPKSVKETAKRYGWKFKTVLSRNKASYPPEYMQLNIRPQVQEYAAQPQTAGFCANCGMPLEVGVNLCKKCGLPINNKGQAGVIPAEHPPEAMPYQKPVQQYSDTQGTFHAQGKSLGVKDINGKSSVLNTIVFWVTWSILALICIIMLTDVFSVLRFVGFTTVAASVVFFRKRLFIRFLPSVFLWLIVFVVFIFIIAVTG